MEANSQTAAVEPSEERTVPMGEESAQARGTNAGLRPRRTFEEIMAMMGAISRDAAGMPSPESGNCPVGADASKGMNAQLRADLPWSRAAIEYMAMQRERERDQRSPGSDETVSFYGNHADVRQWLDRADEWDGVEELEVVDPHELDFHDALGYEPEDSTEVQVADILQHEWSWETC